MEKRIYDVTLTVSPEVPVWPGHTPPRVERLRSMDDGAVNNLSRLETNVHFGTHVDSPLHFIRDGYAMEEVPLDTLLGPCIVAYLPDVDAIEPADLDGLDLPPQTTRLIVRTRNSELWNDLSQGFRKDFVALTPEAAQWVVKRGIRLFGIDYLSVERFEEPGRRTHIALLGAEVVLVEGLDLREIEPGPYELICMPLKLKGSDGAPARVALRTLSPA